MKLGYIYDPVMEPRIREYLLEKQAIHGWTQEEMASALGVKKPSLNRWLHGHFIPDYESMKKIAAGLGVPIQEVLDARDGKYQPMSQAEREALEIGKKYSPEAILVAVEAIVKSKGITKEEFAAALARAKEIRKDQGE